MEIIVMLVVLCLCGVFLIWKINSMNKTGAALETENLAENVTFKIKDMVCEGCAEKITSVLKGSPGIKEVKAHLHRKSVQVRYYVHEVGPKKIKALINKAGFHATEA